MIMTVNLQPQGAKAASQAHNLAVPGSIPGPATHSAEAWRDDARQEIRAAWDTEFLRRLPPTPVEARPGQPTTAGAAVRIDEVRRLCGWCGLWLGGSKDPRAPASHGICPTCKQNLLDELTINPREAA